MRTTAKRKLPPAKRRKYLIVPEFPDGWVCVAAYYTWEKDGQPDGQDFNHWIAAKTQLGDLWNEGNLLENRITRFTRFADWSLVAEKRGSRFHRPHKTFGIKGVQNFAAREPTAARYRDAVMEI